MKSFFVGVGVFLAIAGSAFSDTKVDEVVAAASNYIATADSLSVQASARFNLKVEDVTEEMSADYTLVFRRPDAFSLRLVNPEVEVLWVTDGERFTTYIPPFGQYKIRDSAPEPAGVISEAGFGPLSGAALFLAEIVVENPFEGLSSDADSSSYIGREMIGDAECHHLQFTRGEGRWDLWVDAGEQPLVRRVSPDVSEIHAELAAQGVNAQLSFDVDLTDWAVNAAEDADFEFTPDAGAQSVAQFEAPEPDTDSKQLVGKAAPQFSLDLLGGGTLDLASKRGKEIVILDFWATWCGPCRRAMPIIEKVSKEFAAQDVRLYAVNLQEAPAEINAFLEGEGIDVTVALDTAGAVSEQYMAYAIPQTVIVGKDGLVQVVHVGIGPDFEAELRAELSALVKGESLVD